MSTGAVQLTLVLNLSASMGFGLLLFLGCGNVKMAGATMPYLNRCGEQTLNFVCMHLCTRIRTHVSACHIDKTLIRTHARTHVRSHAHTTHTPHTHAHTHARAHTHIQVRTHVRTRTNIFDKVIARTFTEFYPLWYTTLYVTTISSTSYSSLSQVSLPDLTATCNVNCGCSANDIDMVCGVNGLTYFSPCHAGCENISPSQVSAM